MRPRFRFPVSLTLALQSLAAVALTGCTPDSAIAPDMPPTAGVSSKQATTNARILFLASVAGSATDLFSMNEDGTGMRLLTQAFEASVIGASWAPDGKRVLVSSAFDASSPKAIHVMNEDGTAITQLTMPGVGCDDMFPTSLGRRVVFIRVCQKAALAIMNADGTGITILDPDVVALSLAPSPKGTLLAFSKGDDIWVLDMKTGTRTNITNTPTFTEIFPAFSPSGKRIAFVRQSLTSASILTMNVDGTMVTSILANPSGSVASPQWSPDGRRIAFGANLEISSFVNDVYVFNADGTGLTNLTRTSLVNETPLAWAAY